MKKAKIILYASLLIFVTLLLVYTLSLNNKDEEEKPVSLREQYQKEYIDKSTKEGT